MTVQTSQPETRFQPGQSGNPAGRPPGSRNRSTLAREAALQERQAAFAEYVVAHQQVAIEALTERALAGDMRALRLLLGSYLQRAMVLEGQLEMPSLATAAEVDAAGRRLVGAALAGEVALAEVLALQKVLQHHARLLVITAKMKARPADAADSADAPAPETGEQQENTGAAAPVAPAPPAGEKQENTGPRSPHANCRTEFLPMAQWLQVTGMGARLAASKRTADERVAA